MSGPATSPVSVRIYRPDLPLQSYVTFFYFVEAEQPLSDFLYPEWGNVRFATPGRWTVRAPGYPAPDWQEAVLCGPTDRHSVVAGGGGKTVGFGLTPIGWGRLIGGSAADLVNRVVPLGDQLGVEAAGLGRTLVQGDDDPAGVARLEALLLERLAQRPKVGALVMAVDAALRTRPETVAAFAARAGVPERTLRRVCLRAFGFPPKRLMRLQRFLDTLGLVRTAVGAAVGESIGADYFDQAHFYRDFRDFMAMTPRAYFGAPRLLMAAAAEAQIRAGVTLSFRLPPAPGTGEGASPAQ